jgi:hypothetical protein
MTLENSSSFGGMAKVKVVSKGIKQSQTPDFVALPE